MSNSSTPLPELRPVAASRLRAPLVAAGVFADSPVAISGAPEALAEQVHSAFGESLPTSPGRWSLRTGDHGSLLAIGLGAAADLDAQRIGSFAQKVVRLAREQGIESPAVVLPDFGENGRDQVRHLLASLRLAAYRFDRFRRPPEDTKPLRRIDIVCDRAGSRMTRQEAARASVLTDAVAWARDLGNTPPNVASPAWMVQQARSMARSVGAKIEVLTVPELRRRGMGGILAVGLGSRNAPRLARLRWGRRGPKVALVGKGVTFDTGGISIKPAANMEEMKFDKCGACNVLGLFRAAAELELPVRLSAYVPLAENMPDGASYRPGDIVRTFNGTTVEIINTDAEGRMILADALAWAAKGRPDALVELSTLTGAAVVALGEGGAALYTPSDALATALTGAAAAAGERLWRMPLWPEFREQMKGHHADLKNSGGRWGGANTAAAFLSNFVGDVEQWAHIDIAGPAVSEGSAKSATGYGIATGVDWLTRLGGLVS